MANRRVNSIQTASFESPNNETTSYEETNSNDSTFSVDAVTGTINNGSIANGKLGQYLSIDIYAQMSIFPEMSSNASDESLNLVSPSRVIGTSHSITVNESMFTGK